VKLNLRLGGALESFFAPHEALGVAPDSELTCYQALTQIVRIVRFLRSFHEKSYLFLRLI